MRLRETRSSLRETKLPFSPLTTHIRLYTKMFILPSISLLALACATISSAAPLEGLSGLGNLGALPALPVRSTDGFPKLPGPPRLPGFPNRPLPHPKPEYGHPKPEYGHPKPDYGHPKPHLPKPDLPKPDSRHPEEGVRRLEGRGEYQSIPDIIYVAIDTLKPIVAKLNLDIKVVDKIDKKAVAEDLTKISVALNLALDGLRGVVRGGDYLHHDGVVLTVKSVADLVWTLLDLVFDVLYAVVGAVGILDPDCRPIVFTLGGLLYNISITVFGLVGGLEAALVVLLTPDLADKLTLLKYTNILGLLHLN